MTALTDQPVDGAADPLTEILGAYRREVAELRAEVDNLVTALAAHDVIGQAKGILMATHGISPDAAARLLGQAGRDRATSVLDIATDVVATGTLSSAAGSVRPRPTRPR